MVTAVVPTGENINIIHCENIFIHVKVIYTDKLTGDKKSETVKAQFIARPKYQNEVVHEYEKDIPFETKEELETNLKAGKKPSYSGQEKI
ncbi:hypothetical protein [Peptoniphilus raoultii]|uniref:hypothetical protein n=1 Tax=Peptoniphilus raoultii TaxID=1776387 RepID=UPI0008D9568E|nr:hypothetical protein [Peptoniphilus raoultii]